MKLRNALLVTLAMLLAGAVAATATSITVTTSAGLFTPVPTANQAFFNAPAVATSPYTEGVFTITGDFGFYTGSVDGLHRAPTGDVTQYISVPQDGSNPAQQYVVTFSTTGNNYFGLYWGSLDTYNTITFDTTGGTFTFSGTDLSNLTGVPFDCPPCGNPQASAYYDFTVNGGTLNSVTIGSSNRALEADNFAVGKVPEPSSLLLFGSGLAGLAGLLRRKLTK